MNPLVSLGEFKASLKRAIVVLTEAEVKKVLGFTAIRNGEGEGLCMGEHQAQTPPPPAYISWGFWVIMICTLLSAVCSQTEVLRWLGNSFPVHVCRHHAKTVLWLWGGDWWS